MHASILKLFRSFRHYVGHALSPEIAGRALITLFNFVCSDFPPILCDLVYGGRAHHVVFLGVDIRTPLHHVVKSVVHRIESERHEKKQSCEPSEGVSKQARKKANQLVQHSIELRSDDVTKMILLKLWDFFQLFRTTYLKIFTRKKNGSLVH